MRAHRENHPRHQLMIGLMMISFGVLFLLDRVNIIDFSTTFRLCWPVVLIVLGIVKLRSRTPSPPSGERP
jgi:LiaI-LiaF-like transmembrane region